MQPAIARYGYQPPRSAVAHVAAALAAVAALMASSASAAAPSEEVMTAWRACGMLDFSISVAGVPGSGHFALSVTPNGDTVLETQPDGGTLIVVSGVMLAKGVQFEEGKAVAAFDVRALPLRLVEALLAFATSRKPTDVRGSIDVNQSAIKDPLIYSALIAGGTIKPPWALRGKVERAPSGPIKFSLREEHMNDRGELASTTVDGVWNSVAPIGDLPPQTSLTGWSQLRIRHVASPRDDGRVLYDYVAEPVDPPYATIGELRSGEHGSYTAPTKN
jgi:hypothetical protein